MKNRHLLFFLLICLCLPAVCGRRQVDPVTQMPGSDQTAAAPQTTDGGKTAAAAQTAQTGEAGDAAVPYACLPMFAADGLTYTITTPAIPERALNAAYSDGCITAYTPGYPTQDGACNAAEYVGAPYIKMHGGAWLLLNGKWWYCTHDGPQLDIPDESDILGHPRRELYPEWLLLILENMPPERCGRDTQTWKAPNRLPAA